MKSVIPGDKKNVCFVCGRVAYETHHIFGASDRDVAEKYGLKVYLCWDHHHGTYGAHGREGKKIQEYLHTVGQERWEEIRVQEGMTKEDARKRFIKEFRRSYL